MACSSQVLTGCLSMLIGHSSKDVHTTCCFYLYASSNGLMSAYFFTLFDCPAELFKYTIPSLFCNSPSVTFSWLVLFPRVLHVRAVFLSCSKKNCYSYSYLNQVSTTIGSITLISTFYVTCDTFAKVHYLKTPMCSVSLQIISCTLLACSPSSSVASLR
jgi:hypothetical protein